MFRLNLYVLIQDENVLGFSIEIQRKFGSNLINKTNLIQTFIEIQ